MKLNEYLEAIEKLGFTIKDFCQCHDICPQSIYKYRKGTVPRAHEGRKIQKASNGHVTLKDLGISE